MVDMFRVCRVSRGALVRILSNVVKVSQMNGIQAANCGRHR